MRRLPDALAIGSHAFYRHARSYGDPDGRQYRLSSDTAGRMTVGLRLMNNAADVSTLCLRTDMRPRCQRVLDALRGGPLQKVGHCGSRIRTV